MLRDGIKRKKLVYGALTTVFVLAVVLGVSQRSAVVAQMNDWKLLPQPERLTELYIENHQKLPTTYAPDSPQQFSFTIHNLEYRPTDYTYTVTASGENGKQVLEKGDVQLQNDQYSTLSPTFTLPDLGPRVQINVTLTNNNESIHYWVERV